MKAAQQDPPHFTPARTLWIRLWQRFCRTAVKVFYRQFEITGAEVIPRDQGIILCANHVNALVDPVVVQASTARIIRPLARSGLFVKPWLKPVLHLIGAVPIYRRGDPGVDPAHNRDSFARCYALLAQNECLIIFPEGQSHSDPHLHEMKTGAARMALGALQHNGIAPAVLPVGLTFSHKGRFRSDVLVHYGKPIALDLEMGARHAAVRALTTRIEQGLKSVTLNADSWHDIHLVSRIERFFAMRHGKYRRRSLRQRFVSQQRLIDGQRLLRQYEPERIRALIGQLRMFEKLCRICGVKDYHLHLRYRPMPVAVYLSRMLFLIFFVLPVALWGILNSYLPYKLTAQAAPRLARGRDQLDTAKMLAGLIAFMLFWSLQTWLVYRIFNTGWALVYVLSLLAGALVALRMRGETRQIRDNIRVFFLFMRKKKLRTFLVMKRRQIEAELAKLVRIAGRLAQMEQRKVNSVR